VSVESTDVDWIPLDGAVNARAVVPGVLLRSDNLQGLSARDLNVLVGEHRLEVVIDLRTDVEVALEGPGPMTEVEGVRIDHRSLHPAVKHSEDLVAGAVNPWAGLVDAELPGEDPVVRSYISYLHSRPDSVVAAVRAIAQSDGSVLVHCAAGKDRTGVVVAVLLEAVGVPRAEVVDDYALTNERIEQIYDRLLGTDTYGVDVARIGLDAHRVDAFTMQAVLDVVDERWGGAAAYLQKAGLEDGWLESLRARLVQD
jgi:protein-tyrosine phosphatase